MLSCGKSCISVISTATWAPSPPPITPKPPPIPDALDHEALLFGTHLDDEERSDLAQALQQLHGVLHGHGIDGVGFRKGSDQLAQGVVLSVQEAEHQSHQLGVLNEGLLSPVDHGVGDELLQGTCTQKHWITEQTSPCFKTDSSWSEMRWVLMPPSSWWCLLIHQTDYTVLISSRVWVPGNMSTWLLRVNLRDINTSKIPGCSLTGFLILLGFRLGFLLPLPQLLHFLEQSEESSTQRRVHLLLLFLQLHMHTWNVHKKIQEGSDWKRLVLWGAGSCGTHHSEPTGCCGRSGVQHGLPLEPESHHRLYSV